MDILGEVEEGKEEERLHLISNTARQHRALWAYLKLLFLRHI